MIVLIRVVLALVAMLIALFLALPIIMMAIPFWTVASLTRRMTRFLEPMVISWKEIIEFDAKVGWKPKPWLNAHCAAEITGDSFHVITDAAGWPGVLSIEDSKIVVFGDSFAFGYAINAASSFSQLDPNLGIKAVGAPGYNMAQEVLLMRRYAERLRGKLVVWFIYYGNDLWENLQPNMQDYRTPFVRNVHGAENWEIVSNHVNGAKWWPYRRDDPLRANERFTGVFGDTFLTRRIYSACEFLITAGKSVCAEAGARLAIVSVPTTMQVSPEQWKRRLSRLTQGVTLDPDAPDRRIAEICSKLAIRFVPGRHVLSAEDYIPAEGHWNEKGHAKIAVLLAKLHGEQLHHAAESNFAITEHTAELRPIDMSRSSIV